MVSPETARITFPVDLQEHKIDAFPRSKRNIAGDHTSDVPADSAHVPPDGDLRRAADILSKEKKVVILAGRGALHASQELENRGFLKKARDGMTIDDPRECGDILDDALRNPGPVIVQAVVDPFEPPLPPKITFDQAKQFVKSLLRGEPDREEVLATALKTKIRELI